MVILIVAALTVLSGISLPASLAGLKWAGPCVLLLTGAGITIWFNRGRAFVTAASLFVAFAGYSIGLEFGGESGSVVRAVFTALAILVPFNVLLALAFTERGVFHHFNYRWLMIAIAELLAVVWVASAGRSSFSGTAWVNLMDHWLFRSPPMPIAARMIFILAFAAAVARSWPRSDTEELRPLDIGMSGALVSFFIACEWIASPGVFGVFMSAAGAIMLVALLQESHRLAFRDELTGLPGRRALDERMRGLGPTFVIAMADVDHFKAFNDNHGHATGDQVLKLVAARLAQVEGGGTAYRYGGEEFAVLFPGRSLAEVMPNLEKVRASVEEYKMAVRGPDRPKDPQTGTALRYTRAPTQLLSVTISIGLAERNAHDTSPALVIASADQALYRAKRAGRNRVSA